MCNSRRGLLDVTSGVNMELCWNKEDLMVNAEDLMVKDNIVEASRSMGMFGNLRPMNIPRLSESTLFLEVSLLSSFSLSSPSSLCLSLFSLRCSLLVFPFPHLFLLSFSFNPFPKSVFLPFLPHFPFHLSPQFLLFSNNTVLSF